MQEHVELSHAVLPFLLLSGISKCSCLNANGISDRGAAPRRLSKYCLCLRQRARWCLSQAIPSRKAGQTAVDSCFCGGYCLYCIGDQQGSLEAQRRLYDLYTAMCSNTLSSLSAPQAVPPEVAISLAVELALLPPFYFSKHLV